MPLRAVVVGIVVEQASMQARGHYAVVLARSSRQRPICVLRGGVFRGALPRPWPRLPMMQMIAVRIAAAGGADLGALATLVDEKQSAGALCEMPQGLLWRAAWSAVQLPGEEAALVLVQLVHPDASKKGADKASAAANGGNSPESKKKAAGKAAEADSKPSQGGMAPAKPTGGDSQMPKVVSSSDKVGERKKVDYITEELMGRKPLDEKSREALIKKCGPAKQEVKHERNESHRPIGRPDELAPSRGPRAGGTAVVIAGGGFSQRSAALAYTQARFNTSRVPAVWRSASELRVVVPEHAAGLVPPAAANPGPRLYGRAVCLRASLGWR